MNSMISPLRSQVMILFPVSGSIRMSGPVVLSSMLMSAVVRDGDGVLGAVGRSQTGLVVQFGGHVALDEQDGLAIVVDIEQFGRQRVATVVALTLLCIQVYSHDDDGRGHSGPVTNDTATFSNNVPMLLLPPSEGKAIGGDTRRRTWTPETGTFSRLEAMRTEVVEALAAAGGGAEKLL